MISKLATTPIPIQQNFDVTFSSVQRHAACRRHRRSFLFPLFVLTSHINRTLHIKEYRAWLVKSNQYRRQSQPIPPSLPVCYHLCDNSQACCAATVFLNSLSVSALALIHPHHLCSPPSPSSVDTSAPSCQTPQQHRHQHTGIHAVTTGYVLGSECPKPDHRPTQLTPQGSARCCHSFFLVTPFSVVMDS